MQFNSKIGYMNLTTRQAKVLPVPPAVSKGLLGGRGIGSFLLLQHSVPQADALSPENPIVVSSGLLNGMMAPGAAFASVAAKSPLTGFLAQASIGGFFGTELRRTGLDHLVITGKASRPALISILDGKIKVHDASSVWGRTIPDCQEILRKQFENDDIQTICIGPAGEHTVRFSGVSTRYEPVRMQSGLGAVFGAKNLKAIVTRGNQPLRIANASAAAELDRQLCQRIQSSRVGAELVENGTGILWGADYDRFEEQQVGVDSCFGCQVRCRRRFGIRHGPHSGTYGQTPGYPEDAIWKQTLGIGGDDLLLVSQIVDSSGLDTLESAGLIRWVQDISDRGLLGSSPESVDPLGLKDGQDIRQFLHAVVNKDGQRAIFSDGASRAADKLGKGLAQYLAEVKGLTAVFADGDLDAWQALGISTANAGRDFLRFTQACNPTKRGTSFLENVARPSGLATQGPTASGEHGEVPMLVLATQNLAMVLDILGICDLQSNLINPEAPSLKEFASALSLNLGIDCTADDLWLAAERTFAIERIFNIREGYQNRSDRFGQWHVGSGTPNCGRVREDQVDAALPEYYRVRGWDADGKPSPDTLRKLGLFDIEVTKP